MAKTETKKEEPKELVRTGPAALTASVPDFIKPDGAQGTEHITADDLQMPRLALAQKMSPQLEELNAAYIPGLKEGDMFNSLSGEILGKGPLKFCIVRADPLRGVEFYPREDGGGVKDFEVKRGDPRMRFTLDAEGKSQKPVATAFYDFLIMLLDDDRLGEVIALSFKSSGLKMAKSLNSLIRLRGDYPLCAGRYVLTSEKTQNAKGVFSVFKVTNDGWVDDPERYALAQRTFAAVKDQRYEVDRTNQDRDDGDASFDPQELERRTAM